MASSDMTDSMQKLWEGEEVRDGQGSSRTPWSGPRQAKRHTIYHTSVVHSRRVCHNIQYRTWWRQLVRANWYRVNIELIRYVNHS